MMRTLQNAVISGMVSVVLALGAASYGWTYKAARYEADLQQTKQAVLNIQELTKQMAQMNENMVIIQTEMKYYRRDIDALKKAQDDMSLRIGGIGTDY